MTDAQQIAEHEPNRQWLYDYFNEHTPGTCKWLSLGPANCKCPRCHFDRALTEARRQGWEDARKTTMQAVAEADVIIVRAALHKLANVFMLRAQLLGAQSDVPPSAQTETPCA